MKPARDGTHDDPTRPSAHEAIEATAAAWLAERDAGVSPADEMKFAAWRVADPRHEAAVARLERTWGALQPLRDFRPAAARHPDHDLLAQPARGKVLAFPSWARAIALAAAAFLVVAPAWWALHPGRDAAPAIVHTTTAGGYQRVVLGDGSVLELNGDTSAEVGFSAAERRVKLARGEAHFTVAKNAARPFWVEAGGVAVRAVGTAFNVRVDTREIEVIVSEGRVAVSGVGRFDGGAVSAPPNSRPREIFLSANERAVVPTARTSAAPAAAQIEKIDAGRIRQALSWQEQRVFFVGTPLGEVVEHFNRYNRVQLSLGDPSLAARPVGGSFHTENVEVFVDLLARTREIAVERPDADHIVLRVVR
jgi:transmembrane sensor